MKILGIDYGEKRIGLAIGDETQTFARELTILSPKEFWEQIQSLINEHHISQIALGWPLNMSGNMTEKTNEVKAFQERLEKFVEIKIDITDERLSSQMVGNLPGGDRKIDSLAAQIILQNYLDKRMN